MVPLDGVYTQRYNRRHHCDGQLFRGRYKSILIDTDSYLLQAVRYIHRNPLRAGLAENIDVYEQFQIENDRAVRGVVERVKKWWAEDSAYTKRIEKLKKQIKYGQKWT